MGTAGCACAWKIASWWEIFYVTRIVYIVIALASAFFYVVWLCLFGAKMLWFFQKVSDGKQHHEDNAAPA